MINSAFVTLLSIAAVSIAAFAPAAEAQADRVIIVGHAVMPDGSLREDVAVVIRDGVIRRVMAASEAPEARVVESYPDGVLCPGLIDLGSELGTGGSVFENAEAIVTDGAVKHALDMSRREIELAIQGGVTAAMLVPRPFNVVGSPAPTVRLADDGLGVEQSGLAPLIVCVGPSTWEWGHPPTSLPGAMHVLRSALLMAEQSTRLGPVSQVVGGERAVLLVVGQPEEARALTRLVKEHDLKAVALYSGGENESLEALADADIPTIFPTAGVRERLEGVTAPARFAEMGGTVLFSLGGPGKQTDALRWNAAMAVRYGLDADTARRALTSDAAAIAGVSAKLGSIKPGAVADLVLYSADPLRLDARVERVWLGGRAVHANPTGSSTLEDQR